MISYIQLSLNLFNVKGNGLHINSSLFSQSHSARDTVLNINSQIMKIDRVRPSNKVNTMCQV